MPNLIAVDQMVQGYLWRLDCKLGTSRTGFQGHTRLLELTRIGQELTTSWDRWWRPRSEGMPNLTVLIIPWLFLL